MEYGYACVCMLGSWGKGMQVFKCEHKFNFPSMIGHFCSEHSFAYNISRVCGLRAARREHLDHEMF